MHLSGNLDDLKGNWKMIEVIDELPIEEIRKWQDVFDVRKNRAGYTVITRQDPQIVLERLRRYSSSLQISDMNLREIYLATTGYTGDSSNASTQTLV